MPLSWEGAPMILWFILFSISAIADEKPCEQLLRPDIDPKWVKQMVERDRRADARDQIIRSAIQSNPLLSITYNPEILENHSPIYNLELFQSSSRLDQLGSGRCWIFAGVNLVRSKLIALGIVDESFELSENYLWFFHFLEQANSHLERVIQESRTFKEMGDFSKLLSSSLNQGGWFPYFADLVERYGLVPKQTMPETSSSRNPTSFMQELNRIVAASSLEIAQTIEAQKQQKMDPARALIKLRVLKRLKMQAVWKVLSTHLGSPPIEGFDFTFIKSITGDRGANQITRELLPIHFTPQEFAKGVIHFNRDDFVVVSSSPLQPYMQTYHLPYSEITASERNTNEGMRLYLNLDIKRLEELTSSMLHQGIPVWFAADITKDVWHSSGIMHPGLFNHQVYGFNGRENPLELSRHDEILLHLGNPNHAMVITGEHRTPDGTLVKFKVENSWGGSVGQNGIYHMYDKWFEKHVFEIVVAKSLLNERELQALAGEPIRLDGTTQRLY